MTTQPPPVALAEAEKKILIAGLHSACHLATPSWRRRAAGVLAAIESGFRNPAAIYEAIEPVWGSEPTHLKPENEAHPKHNLWRIGQQLKGAAELHFKE